MEMDELESGAGRKLVAGLFPGFRTDAEQRATKLALEDFLAQPAPRAVPKKIFADVHAMNSNAMMSGCVKVLLVFFLVSMLAGCVFFFPKEMPVEILVRLGWSNTAPAEVTEFAATSSTVRYDDDETLRVYRVSLRFVSPEGGLVETAYFVDGEDAVPGYSTGSFDKSGRAARPIRVTAVYFPPSPGMAYVAGGRMSRMPSFFALIAVFPAIAIVVILFQGRKRRGIRRLLSEGMPAVARLTGVEKTSLIVNDEQQYWYSLRFDRPDGMGESSVKACGEKARYLRRCLEEGRAMRVLYLPYSPDKVLVLHDIDSPAPS